MYRCLGAINSIRQRKTKNSNAKKNHSRHFISAFYVKTHTRQSRTAFEFYLSHTKRERAFKQKSIDSCSKRRRRRRSSVMQNTENVLLPRVKVVSKQIISTQYEHQSKSSNHTWLVAIVDGDDDDGQSQCGNLCVCVLTVQKRS